MAKTSKSAKTERQKLIDDAMKKQRGAEKRRSFAIVGVCLLVALVIIGAAAWQPLMNWLDEREFEGLELADIGAGPSVCGKVDTKVAEGAVNNHVEEGVPVPYEDSPPAFGPHWNVAGLAPAPFERKFYDADDRPPLEALVHNLEHGYTILWYDETITGEKLAQVRSIAKKFDTDDDNFRLKFIAAPWTSEDGDPFPDGQHVAFTHWAGTMEESEGVWQYCSDVSGEALEDFMNEYPYTDSPESGAM